MLPRARGLLGFAENQIAYSVIFFAGFFVAMHIMIGVLLTPVLMMRYEAMLMDPALYFQRHGVWTSGLIAAIFIAFHLAQPHIIRLQTGAHRPSPHDGRRLDRIVRHLAATAGMPMPALQVMDSPAINAMTTGLSRSRATITVTRGLLHGLDDDALAAVMAHEIAHIRRGDVAFMSVAYSALDTIHLLRRLNPLSFTSGVRWLVLFVFPLLFVLALCGLAQHVAMTVANITRLLISSARDYAADAEAVRLTHNPQALARALQLAHGRDHVAGLSPVLGLMMFSGAEEGMEAHHAPFEQRIAALHRYAGSMMAVGVGPVRDTRAASLAAYGGSAYARPAPRTQFGRAPAMGFQNIVPAPPPRKVRNLVDRVNTDNPLNVFGYRRGERTAFPFVVLGVFLVLFFVPRMVMGNMERAFGGSGSIVPIDSTLSPGGSSGLDIQSQTVPLRGAASDAPRVVPVPRLKPAPVTVTPREGETPALAQLRR